MARSFNVVVGRSNGLCCVLYNSTRIRLCILRTRHLNPSALQVLALERDIFDALILLGV
jgi:hypothetical protein